MISVRELTSDEIKEKHFSKKQSICAKRKIKLINNATIAELSFLTQLKKTDIKFQFQKGFIAGGNFVIVDFYFPDYKKVIEIDGNHHYNLLKQKERDTNRTRYLNSRGIEVIRLSNKEAFKIKSWDVKKILCN